MSCLAAGVLERRHHRRVGGAGADAVQADALRLRSIAAFIVQMMSASFDCEYPPSDRPRGAPRTRPSPPRSPGLHERHPLLDCGDSRCPRPTRCCRSRRRRSCAARRSVGEVACCGEVHQHRVDVGERRAGQPRGVEQRVDRARRSSRSRPRSRRGRAGRRSGAAPPSTGGSLRSSTWISAPRLASSVVAAAPMPAPPPPLTTTRLPSYRHTLMWIPCTPEIDCGYEVR